MRLHLSAPPRFTEFPLKMFSEYSLRAVTVQRLTELMSIEKYSTISKRASTESILHEVKQRESLEISLQFFPV